MPYRKYDPKAKPKAAKLPRASANAKANAQKLANTRLEVAKQKEAATALEAAQAAATLAEAKAKRAIAAAQRRALRAEKRASAAADKIEQVKAHAELAEATTPSDGHVRHSLLQKDLDTGRSVGAHLSSKTRTARANLYAAFEDMGGVKALVRWGKDHPGEFYKIWARLIPVEVEDETKTLPLETLLDKLAQRSHQTIEEAATAIGRETLNEAGKTLIVEDAAAAMRTLQ